jgi:hypothetical protein
MQTEPVDWNIPHEQTWMSTTDKENLTTEFEANHGPDKTLVFDGAVSYPFLGTGPVFGPRDFADGPRLQTPFFYDPSKGNLLIESRDFDKDFLTPVAIDVTSVPNVRGIINVGDANAATGTALNSAAVFQFEFDVPQRGDFNQDGAVDAADYVVWRNELGTIYTQSDYDVWRANFGQMAGVGAASRAASTHFVGAPPLRLAEPAPAVPEPTSIVLCGCSLLLFAAIQSRPRPFSRQRVPFMELSRG